MLRSWQQGCRGSCEEKPGRQFRLVPEGSTAASPQDSAEHLSKLMALQGNSGKRGQKAARQ